MTKTQCGVRQPTQPPPAPAGLPLAGRPGLSHLFSQGFWDFLFTYPLCGVKRTVASVAASLVWTGLCVSTPSLAAMGKPVSMTPGCWTDLELGSGTSQQRTEEAEPEGGALDPQVLGKEGPSSLKLELGTRCDQHSQAVPSEPSLGLLSGWPWALEEEMPGPLSQCRGTPLRMALALQGHGWSQMWVVRRRFRAWQMMAILPALPS